MLIKLNNHYLNMDRVETVRLYVTEFTAERAAIVADIADRDGRHRQLLIDSCPNAERSDQLNHYRRELDAICRGAWIYEINGRG